MSVLPFAPGVLPGRAPGAGGQPPASTAEVAAEAGGAPAESLAFPDPGAEFAAALTAALMGVPTPPAPTARPGAAAPAPAAHGSVPGAAGAASPDRPAVVGGATAGWQAPAYAATVTAATTSAATTTGPTAAAETAVPASGPVRTAHSATVAPGAPAPSAGEEPVPAPPAGSAGTPTAEDAPNSAGAAERPPWSADPGPEPGRVEPPAAPARTTEPAVPSLSVASTASVTVAPAAEQDPVVRQVLPEVMQLATKGNGTHRISVTLQPEHLGEVRVTMVVRDGEVRVSLAADGQSAAKDALLQGAPELRRLLEATGATDTRVVVRDLPTTSPTSTPTERGPGDRAHSAAADPDGRSAGNGDGRDDSRHPGEQRREDRGVVPAPTIQRAAPAATPTPGRLDRTV